MDPDDAHEFDNEQQFWDDLDETLSQQSDTHSLIDDALRSYLSIISKYRGIYIESDYDLGCCSYKLATSPLFINHADYVRQQFIHCLLQEDELDTLLVATSFLLTDARTTEHTFELLNQEGAFSRLVELISSPKHDEEEGLHRLLMELFYEMARIQKISLEDLASVDDDFVRCLFSIIEQVSGDVNDPYHYPVIRVLLVLNEQFMVAAHDPDHAKRTIPLTNKVIKVLSSQGNKYKTFGENIILLLNREDETSLQLLTLKLLYLLFTTPPTYEYFYTNDLRVLVDILIRNLLDLPEEASALRHTYLRVLYPLLEHTQLQSPPHYKRHEIRKLLTVLGGGRLSDSQYGSTSENHWSHFDEVDDTTKRLVRRCQSVTWLVEENEPVIHVESPIDDTASNPTSPVSPSKSQPPALPAPRKLKKRNSSKGSTLSVGQYLTPQLESARHSSLSMMEMATQKEKPGIITPSRNPSLKHGLRAAIMNRKERPPPPKARRSAWTRIKVERSTSDLVVTKTSMPAEQAAGLEDDATPAPIFTESSERQTNTDIEPSPQVPVPPSPSSKPVHKKPPPAPKARRWRGKRTKEDDPGSGSVSAADTQTREPGRFDSKLPSINTNQSNAEDSKPKLPADYPPFSPHKTLSPTFSDEESSKNTPSEPWHKSSVSDALAQAQAQAVSGITETLEKASLTTSSTTPVTPIAIRHEYADTNTDTDAGDFRPQEQEQQQSEEIRPHSRIAAVLAPPNPAPPRAIPGPRWELERSPFLSEADDQDENEPVAVVDKDNNNTVTTTRAGAGIVQQRQQRIRSSGNTDGEESSSLSQIESEESLVDGDDDDDKDHDEDEVDEWG